MTKVSPKKHRDRKFIHIVLLQFSNCPVEEKDSNITHYCLLDSAHCDSFEEEDAQISPARDPGIADCFPSSENIWAHNML